MASVTNSDVSLSECWKKQLAMLCSTTRRLEPTCNNISIPLAKSIFKVLAPTTEVFATDTSRLPPLLLEHLNLLRMV